MNQPNSWQRDWDKCIYLFHSKILFPVAGWFIIKSLCPDTGLSLCLASSMKFFCVLSFYFMQDVMSVYIELLS